MFFHSHIGEIAGLIVAVLWTISALAFEKAGHRVGSLSVNIIRLALAIILLGLTTLILYGHFFPKNATIEQWFWLGLSGVIGFFVGDLMLFQAYVLIGARMSTLIFSSAPLFTAIIGWLFLGEIMMPKNIIGMLISVTGIAIAISSKKMKLDIPLSGFLFALGGALGQAVGLVLSKKGIGNYNPIEATQIRAIFGAASFAIFLTIVKKWANVKAALKEGNALKFISIGTIFGPFVGVSLSLFAIQHTKTGIAATLMALVPVLIIIPSVLFLKEKIKPQQIIGTIICMVGISIFFL